MEVIKSMEVIEKLQNIVISDYKKKQDLLQIIENIPQEPVSTTKYKVSENNFYLKLHKYTHITSEYKKTHQDYNSSGDEHNYINSVIGGLGDDAQFNHFNNFNNFKSFFDNVNVFYDKKKKYIYMTEQKYMNIDCNLFMKYHNKLLNTFTYETNNDYMIQKIKLPSNTRIIYVGDFHSSIYSLYTLINNNLDMFIIRDGIQTLTLKDNCYIFFLGDIVDRGPFSIELLFFIIMLKLYNLNNIYIIRGNHEVYSLYSKYGFGKEMDNQFTKNIDIQLFYYLPVCIYLYIDGNNNDKGKEWIHLSHGAFENRYSEEMYKTIEFNSKKMTLMNFLNSDENIVIIDKTFLHSENHPQYMWGDFDINIAAYQQDSYSKRSKFSINDVKNYCSYNNIKCLLTGHQDYHYLCLVRERGEESININNNSYNRNYFISSTKIYNMYCLKEPSDINKKIILKPGEDFMALTTSTAKIARDMCCDAWLVMNTTS